MADIDLVIKIPEEIYQHYKKIWQKRRGSIPESYIAFGIPLTKGHGRLIDGKALGDYFWEHRSKLFAYKDLQSAIDHATTIIEADKEDE